MRIQDTERDGPQRGRGARAAAAALAEIADELHLSRNTVKTQIGAVYRKLLCGTGSEAVTNARDLGLLPG